MKTKSWPVVPLLLISLAAYTQEDSGSIRGTISGPQGDTVPFLWVQATETSSGKKRRAEVDSEGQFEFADLPPGTFTLLVNPLCCTYEPYQSEELLLESGESRDIDIQLKEGISLTTIGDDPAVAIAEMKLAAEVPDGPMPRLADGKPDLSGMWVIEPDPFPEAIDAHDWAEALFQARLAAGYPDLPTARCLPGDGPISWWAKLVHQPDLLVVLLEDLPGFRQIYLDGREHPDDISPTWVGHSVGWWDNDTLVVDTIGYNDRGWIELYPRSEQLHVTERYTRTDLGRMDLEITYEDPKVFQKAWVKKSSLYLVPGADVMEYVCENNRW